MKRWGLRHKGFRVGFIGVAICSLFYLIGFGAPAWQNSSGLWMFCTDEFSLCVSHSKFTSYFPAWFDAVRAFECLGLIFILLCIAAEWYMDCLSQPSTDRRLVELLALVAGTCGLTGSIIFAAYTPINSSSNRHHRVYLSWGFGLSTAASSFLIIFACIIAYFRRKGLDMADYAASNAMHYCRSDEAVSPQGVSAVDMAPPAYSEVVSEPSGCQGSSWSHSAENAFYKASVTLDSQPPPAYYPPPPSGQFQAPPAYAIVPSYPLQHGQSGGLSEGGSEGMRPSTTVTGPAATVASEVDPDPTGGSPEDQTMLDSSVSMTSPVSSLPAYYVTVLGQMVPVYREELQQAGQEVPAMGAPVPAYFIVVQGQHVPVYSEEQARTLAN